MDFRSSHQRCSIKKGVLREFAKFTGKGLCLSLFLIKLQEPCNFIKKETLAQVFSCEFCEISRNTFFTEHLWTTGFEESHKVSKQKEQIRYSNTIQFNKYKKALLVL